MNSYVCIPMNIYAYYYPGFFEDNYRISGSEWKLLQDAKARRTGHYQPRIPLQGYYDQTQYATCKAQIELAQSYGIKGFMVCFYWDFESSIPILGEVLDVLMRAMEGTTFEFNIMWVLRLPHQSLPIEQGSYGKYHNHPWFKKRIQHYRHDSNFHQTLARITSHPNYRKGPDGKPLLQLYSVSELHELHGQETKEILHSLRAYHLQAVCGRNDDWISESEGLGLQSLSSYVTLVDFNTQASIHYHKACVDAQKKVWDTIQDHATIPFYPSVSTGWDASPRGSFLQGFKVKKFPWAPVVIDANPLDFETNLKLALAWCRQHHVDLHIASWNEWSEGHYLEPDERFGFQYLEKVLHLTESR